MNLEALQKQLKLRFGTSSDVCSGEAGLQSLEAFGFPCVYQIDCYLSKQAARQYMQTHRITYPDVCSVCGAPEVSPKEVKYKTSFLKSYTVLGVPFCHEHFSIKNAPVIIQVNTINSALLKMIAISSSENFLLELRSLNSVQTPLKPWEAFVDLNAESSGWRQGEAEAWWNVEWGPYWQALSQEDRQCIIEDSGTPIAWKQKLSN